MLSFWATHYMPDCCNTDLFVNYRMGQFNAHVTITSESRCNNYALLIPLSVCCIWRTICGKVNITVTAVVDVVEICDYYLSHEYYVVRFNNCAYVSFTMTHEVRSLTHRRIQELKLGESEVERRRRQGGWSLSLIHI